MKIWINNPFDFLPGEGARLQRYGLLAQALVKAGHQVVWWSSDWNHIKKEKREGASDRSPVQMGETPRQGEADPEIRLIKTLPYFKNIGLRRLLSHWLYARAWERLAWNEQEMPDLIICSAPPLSTGWVMRRLCSRFGCAGVIDVMDVWPETFERVAPAWMLWPLRWMAKRVYAGADGISAVGDSYLEVVKGYLEECANARMRECGNKHALRTSVYTMSERSFEASGAGARSGIPRWSGNGSETPRQGKPMYRCYHGIEMGGESRGERSLARADGPLRLVYVGNMGKGYDLVTLVRAVAEMIDEGHAISLDLAGKGEQEEKLQALARTTRENIRFHGVVTGDALCALIAQADVGVVPMFEKTYVAVPYKLADYAAAGLPVMSSLKGETEELIKRYDAGWCYEAGDILSLKRAIQACGAERLSPNGQLRKQRARQMAEEHFDAGKIYPDFVAWLEKIVAAKGVKGEKLGAL